MSQTVDGISIIALRWFECDGNYIAIDRSASVQLKELALADADISAVHDLVDMVLLDELDRILCCLDDWVGRPFDWIPMNPVLDNTDDESLALGQALPLHELRTSPGLTARMTSLENESQTLLLALDPATLNALPPFPEAWQSLVAFNRYLKPMKLELQQFPLTNEERHKLGNGAMVLLPRSFAVQWQARLVAIEEYSWELDAPGSVLVDPEHNRVQLLPPAVKKAEGESKGESEGESKREVVQSDTTILTVELEEMLYVNELYTESVWQSQKSMVIALPQAVEGARLVITVKSGNDLAASPQHDKQNGEQNSELAWSGQLMKVGEGYGVVLEEQAV